MWRAIPICLRLLWQWAARADSRELHCRQQQGYENANDGDDNEQLDEGESKAAA
jgi:hypothetical protein